MSFPKHETNRCSCSKKGRRRRCLGLPCAVALGKEAGVGLSDSAEAEPGTPGMCSEILEEVCFSSVERSN